MLVNPENIQGPIDGVIECLDYQIARTTDVRNLLQARRLLQQTGFAPVELTLKVGQAEASTRLTSIPAVVALAVALIMESENDHG